ncbi:hypothetical protein M1M34_gp110 [Haloarcula tailed virus 2]|uniref:Uncharacterized protein n=1 Tax=Haloarcula tailed virus 2 TaxID=2877989 RepID=A0AAE9BZA5_9CAUD|nr:hypothetical protein M1M34_gp110 [Haloarcula tailed virus 2]UBF23223.1 hypothetical protein HATV-2_gp72 [Haloarcula tailed virus 2]
MDEFGESILTVCESSSQPCDSDNVEKIGESVDDNGNIYDLMICHECGDHGLVLREINETVKIEDTEKYE